MTVRAKIEEQKNGEFRVEFVGGNGEAWYQSTEGYTTDDSAWRSFEEFLIELGSAAPVQCAFFNKDGEQINAREFQPHA